ncbi:MAG: GNAT family N-acetyltransferase [Candidatus Paceibacterota bacterium]|jgi:GNAT superfamily N-acetyltransferase
MEIRFAKIKDEKSVLKLLDELGIELNEKVGYSTRNIEAQEKGGPIFQEIINRKDMRIFVALENQEMVGLVTFYILPNIRHGIYRGHIEDFIVTKNKRGQGIGTKLFNAVKDFCKTNNIKVIKLDTNNNLEAHSFYLKNGGEQTEIMYRFNIE